jgi:hypothetical protein
LRSELKARGLVSDLGVQVDQSTAGTLLYLMLDLTPKSVKDKGTAATNIVFDYLAKLRNDVAAEVKSIYPTLASMSLVTMHPKMCLPGIQLSMPRTPS